MSERKVLNKYYPPDFDPSKIPRMKLAKNRQYTVRLMAPFNMRCKTCGEYIYKGKKFNARKEDVEHETYLGIRIYRFYIKCTRCLQEISFKTDPQNTDYEIEAGATRNFMALKLAEEQARKEEEELREEEANNPMKLLENRTEQSRNEIELLESLEELRDLNRRQQTVDYATMLQVYDNTETERQRLERQEREDEDFIKSVNFKTKNIDGKKFITEEIIEDFDDTAPPQLKKPNLTTSGGSNSTEFVAPFSIAPKNSFSVGGLSNSKNSLKSMVKRKIPLVKPKDNTNSNDKMVISRDVTVVINQPNDKEISLNDASAVQQPEISTKNGLSLLTAYSDSSEESE